MRKIVLMCLMFISVLFVLSACGDGGDAANDNTEKAANKPEVGLNEITLDELIEKKNNNEAFYVLLYEASQKNVEQTKLLEAYDEALKQNDITAFYLNIKDKNEETLSSLEDEFESQSSSSHNPFEDGGLTIVYDGKIDSPFDYYAESRFLNMIIETNADKGGTFVNDKELKSKIERGIKLGKDYVNEYSIELTY